MRAAKMRDNLSNHSPEESEDSLSAPRPKGNVYKISLLHFFLLVKYNCELSDDLQFVYALY